MNLIITSKSNRIVKSPLRMRVLGLIFISLGILFSFPEAAFAETIRVQLKDILQVENIRLEGIKDSTDKYEFKLSIPERWQVKQAMLTFSYSHS
ncbi:MAG: hypothetical protein HQK63_06535, partial [Desulfamplus sp.]|nr:hypothetical protein [Desulfamplus sp.]